MPRKTKIDILRERCLAARIGFTNAQSAYRAAEAALNKAERAAAQRKARQPRYEYAVLLIDQYGDAHDTYFHDTLAEARKDAVRCMNEPNDPDNDTKIVGVVIERILLSDLSRTTVQTHGKVAKEWLAS